MLRLFKVAISDGLKGDVRAMLQSPRYNDRFNSLPSDGARDDIVGIISKAISGKSLSGNEITNIIDAAFKAKGPQFIG
jgi:hypothetical protein